MRQLRVLDLFSGIGGFSLGLERAGMRTVAFCEIEPYCQAVLRKHWPNVPIYEDVRTLTAERLRADGISVDLICGGFPCQDVSKAGRRRGLEGERSGLWSEFARLLGELRPRYAIVENTPGLLSLGMGRVLGDLASLGFDAEWHCIPASAVGAQHIRDRIWIVAYADSDADGRRIFRRDIQGTSEAQQDSQQGAPRQRLRPRHSDGLKNDFAYPVQPGLSARQHKRAHGGDALGIGARLGLAELAVLEDRSFWRHQPLLGRGIHGIPRRVDRIAALGNAVFPKIPEIIGRAILEAEEGRIAA